MVPVTKLIPAKMSEAELMELIRNECIERNLIAFHCPDSRRSRLWTPGFPDLVIAGPRGVLFRECKDMHHTPTPDQRLWGLVLRDGEADWGLWRPDQWVDGTISAELAALG